MATNSGDDPPKSNDLAGWQKAHLEGRLRKFRLEDIVASFQDLDPVAGRAVRNSLAEHLSKAVYGYLHRWVGSHHPNRGQDIIDRVHMTIFTAILQPSSADGKGLRKAFIHRLKLRTKDALIVEDRAFRHLAPAGQNTPKSPEKLDKSDLTGPETARTLQNFPAPPQYVEEQFDVDRFLEENIPDAQRRLAFRLHMEGLPAKSSRTDSIAAALNIDEKTARTWIDEIQEILKLRAGDRV
eukprot:TRINITY_DN1222_c0_g2_i1.p1 TRINITY_DN1222_c0_g2~~TRINITY_DN1222_c0_g2_i1.p1  ORF type:complete len:239 (-),score=34.65 TRINITY_DN1222_c0_g2_i1:48-764(-)